MGRSYGKDRTPTVNDGVDVSLLAPQYSSDSQAWVYWWDPVNGEGVVQVWVGEQAGGYDHVYFTAQDLGRLPILVLAGDGTDYSFVERTNDTMLRH